MREPTTEEITEAIRKLDAGATTIAKEQGISVQCGTDKVLVVALCRTLIMVEILKQHIEKLEAK